MARPLVLIHGYSDEGKSLETWRAALARRRSAPAIEVHLSESTSR